MKGIIITVGLLTLTILLFVTLTYDDSWLLNKDDGRYFKHSFTKAFCEGNVCRDFLVECLSDEVLEMKPISGFVTFGSDWVDEREEKELC